MSPWDVPDSTSAPSVPVISRLPLPLPLAMSISATQAVRRVTAARVSELADIMNGVCLASLDLGPTASVLQPQLEVSHGNTVRLRMIAAVKLAPTLWAHTWFEGGYD
jgi:hypothetical protein